MKDVLFYKILRPIIKCFTLIFFHPKIVGKENIKKNDRLVLAGNHTSIFDPLLLISCTKREIHFLAKSSLWKGFKKIIFSNLGLIPVKRDGKDSKALDSAIECLENNLVVGIFPEGTTEKGSNKLLPFKKGAVRMARSTNSLIVPFYISGKYSLFSNNLTIIFDKPYYIKTDDLDSENDILKNKIENLKRGNN